MVERQQAEIDGLRMLVERLSNDVQAWTNATTTLYERVNALDAKIDADAAVRRAIAQAAPDPITQLEARFAEATAERDEERRLAPLPRDVRAGSGGARRSRDAHRRRNRGVAGAAGDPGAKPSLYRSPAPRRWPDGRRRRAPGGDVEGAAVNDAELRSLERICSRDDLSDSRPRQEWCDGE